MVGPVTSCAEVIKNKTIYNTDPSGLEVSTSYDSPSSVSSNIPTSKFTMLRDGSGNRLLQTFYNTTADIISNTPNKTYARIYSSGINFNGIGNNLLTNVDYGNTAAILSNTPTYKYTATRDAAGNQISVRNYNNAAMIAANTPNGIQRRFYDGSGNRIYSINYASEIDFASNTSGELAYTSYVA